MSRVASGSSLGVDWADETEDHPRSRAPASLAHGGSSFSTAKGDDSDGREDEDVFEVDVGGGGAPSGERLILRKNTSPAGHAASHAASHGVTQKTLRRSASEASASLMATAAAEGWISLLVPHGMLMVAAREVPYAGCLFFLSAKIRAALEPPEGAAAPLATRVPRDLLAACVCACVAGPLSQVPCTIAAYQQAHALGIGAACAAISRTGIGFFAGLTARTASLAGSLFVFPFTMEELQPVAERLFPQR